MLIPRAPPMENVSSFMRTFSSAVDTLAEELAMANEVKPAVAGCAL